MAHDKQTTIYDVAEMANVSVATVSRVFNGKDRVSTDTRQKVQEAMQALNYQPSTIATSMITGKTKVILVMVPDFENSYFARVLAGIEQKLRQEDYYAMVLSHNGFSQEQYQQIQMKFDRIVDGVIAIPDPNLAFYKAWDKPCVIIDRYFEEVGLSTIRVNNYHGGRILARELVNTGHKKIAVIGAEPWMVSINERVEGYRSVLKENDIPLRQDYEILGDLRISTGYQGMKRLMRLLDPPTAVIAENNMICIGCMQACQELNLRIGTDISLVGYDDHEVAQYAHPGITVVRQPAYEMGECAAEEILKQLNGTTDTHKVKTLDVELIRRGSVARQ